MSRNLYSEVSARILSQLEAGAVPWVKPWSATPGQNVPHNAATGRPYSGVNVVLLMMGHDLYATPRYLTFKQAKALGGNVKKGEHGTRIYFVKKLLVKDKAKGDDADPRAVSMLREYVVFNTAQCENLPERIVTPQAAKPRNNDERDATIDEFVAATGADIREGYGEAYYAPGPDYVSMPAFKAFNSATSFYAVEFHELAHWTGAKSRLDRQFGARFGDKAYAAEELVAELTAAFLCAEFSIDGETRHAGYIASWIRMLKDDPKAFFTAASAAQKAADHLRGLALQEVVEIEAEPLPLAA